MSSSSRTGAVDRRLDKDHSKVGAGGSNIEQFDYSRSINLPSHLYGSFSTDVSAPDATSEKELVGIFYTCMNSSSSFME